MPTCKKCGDEAETLVTVKVAGKAKKFCEDCADRAREEGEVAEQSEAVVQNMMGVQGRRWLGALSASQNDVRFDAALATLDGTVVLSVMVVGPGVTERPMVTNRKATVKSTHWPWKSR